MILIGIKRVASRFNVYNVVSLINHYSAKQAGVIVSDFMGFLAMNTEDQLIACRPIRQNQILGIGVGHFIDDAQYNIYRQLDNQNDWFCIPLDVPAGIQNVVAGKKYFCTKYVGLQYVNYMERTNPYNTKLIILPIDDGEEPDDPDDQEHRTHLMILQAREEIDIDTVIAIRVSYGMDTKLAKQEAKQREQVAKSSNVATIASVAAAVAAQSAQVADARATQTKITAKKAQRKVEQAVKRKMPAPDTSQSDTDEPGPSQGNELRRSKREPKNLKKYE